MRLSPRFLGLAMVVALPAVAQTPAAPAPHIRGTVKTLAGDTLTVQPAAGAPVAIKLAAAWSVVVMKPVDVATIKAGSFIGTTTIEKPDGTGRSLEVHVFPPGVKMGEGHYDWDLKPNSKMTNGTVGKVVDSPKGRTLEVAYPGGAHTVVVPANVPVVQITPGARTLLTPGVKVFIVAARLPVGGLTANNVAIGVNGAAPPM